MRQFPPVPFGHLNVKLSGRTLDALPGFIALFIAHSLDLVETRNSIPNVRRIM
jgi:hypothetical protein